MMNVKAPKIKFVEYNKYGFVKTIYQSFSCPVCDEILDAGPNYQPKHCSKCGQKLDFSLVEFVPEKFVGYTK